MCSAGSTEQLGRDTRRDPLASRSGKILGRIHWRAALAGYSAGSTGEPLWRDTQQDPLPSSSGGILGGIEQLGRDTRRDPLASRSVGKLGGIHWRAALAGFWAGAWCRSIAPVGWGRILSREPGKSPKGNHYVSFPAYRTSKTKLILFGQMGVDQRSERRRMTIGWKTTKTIILSTWEKLPMVRTRGPKWNVDQASNGFGSKSCTKMAPRQMEPRTKTLRSHGSFILNRAQMAMGQKPVPPVNIPSQSPLK